MNEQTPVSLPLGLVNAVLQYCGTRPYSEVFQLISALQGAVAPQLEKTEEPASAAE